MILYPAIDLKDGACVRLVRGEMGDATVFNRDPADQARQFAEQGFAWIHVVLSLIHISEPTRPAPFSRMPSSA